MTVCEAGLGPLLTWLIGR